MIYIGKGDDAAVKKISDAGIKVSKFYDFLATGSGEELQATPPKPDDICCIMYTRWVVEVWVEGGWLIDGA